MKRLALIVGAALGIAMGSGPANASWGSLGYSGYQPWWNVFAHRYKCMTPEEERLQHFWHDYYDALEKYYGALDNMDWVAYYKNHGYQINGACAGGACGGAPCGQPCRINYAPVFVSPSMQWAVPNSCLNGPPTGAPGYPAGGPGCSSAAAAAGAGY